MAVINVSASPVHIGRFKILPGDCLPALPLTAEEEADVERLIHKALLARTMPPEADKESRAVPKSDKGKDKVDKPKEKSHGPDD